jgi:hypothetical protein
MKTAIFAAVLAAGAFVVPQAFAQDVIVVPGEVDSYVAEQPYDDTVVLDNDVPVGDSLPDSVTVREIPDSDYGYVVTQQRRYVVEPSTRRVIKIYE